MVREQINFILVQNRQGRTRLSKWYTPLQDAEKHAIEKDVFRVVATRDDAFTNFVEFNMGKHTHKLIYRRYAALNFVFCVDEKDNELGIYEAIHLLVEALDGYFGSVCELDLIFQFNKVFNVVDEYILGGKIQETNVKKILNKVKADDKLTD
ncbi:AP-2 complex subunit sigma [Hondaea fermentalgiana]|uniref:AP complex subunit sigma n=1 Tax=Hondaea fermentalgiana TaxID=2315210 RepID=A0A2R5GB81_9STRA|nr:AP-2 complex subunit sigma [Hondaea fermentalgiana]|eukprot:GBG28252.1 AP-2 complex subunit sigma [Hondaea fermentalgiana]